MKQLLIPFFTCLLATKLSAQNLAFNQVKLISVSDTVPAGKVWKITNVLPSSNASNNVILIEVNGVNIAVKGRDYMLQTNSNYTPATAAWTTLNGAYWLPAGTALAKGSYCEYISVIEFNTQ